MNKENSALKLVDEIILYYDVRSKKNIKLESLWAQEHDFNYLKITRTKNHKLDAIGVVAVKRNEISSIWGDVE